jgi:urate oxidase
MKLIQHQYGKARVRVLKVTRKGSRHSIKELEVAVGLEGDFDDSFTKADNRLVVATDTMKNTVNVLAREKLGAETEEFGVILGKHFLKNYPQVSRVEIRLSEHCWERLRIAGKDHTHAFAEKGAARPFARIVGTKTGERVETVVESGIEDLLILKSSGSGFEQFLRDKYTTLPETGDRILATRLKACWTYARTPKRFSATNAGILDAMLQVFANNYSPSVQVTLFQMGEAALAAAPEISQIRLTLPNQHCLLINLAPFGLENENELFVPTDEPHGQIEGTVSR